METVINTKRKVNARKTAKSVAMTPTKIRHLRCYLFGAFIPALVFAFSSMSGQFALVAQYGLALVFLCLTLTLLALSLTHVAESLHHVFGGSRWSSWIMAIVIDAGLVACETASVFAPDESTVMRWFIMGTVVVASMYLNIAALIRHADTNAKKKSK